MGNKLNGALELKKLLTGQISPSEAYPKGLTAIQYEVDGVKMVGVAGEMGRFDMDKVLRLLKLLELYTV